MFIVGTSIYLPMVLDTCEDILSWFALWTSHFICVAMTRKCVLKFNAEKLFQLCGSKASHADHELIYTDKFALLTLIH